MFARESCMHSNLVGLEAYIVFSSTSLHLIYELQWLWQDFIEAQCSNVTEPCNSMRK